MKAKVFLLVYFFICKLYICQVVKYNRFLEISDSLISKKINYDNTNGSLAWNVSYLLESYNYMYRKTKDLKYLFKLVEVASNVLANSDIEKNIHDFRGKSEHLWSSTKYSDSAKRYSWVVHTGMITYPIAVFCNTIINDESLQQLEYTNGEKMIFIAKEMIKKIEKSVSCHNDEWSFKKGTYLFERNSPIKEKKLKLQEIPVNQYASIGKTLLELYSFTGKIKYKKRVKLLAEHFKSNLTTIDSSFVWKYHPLLEKYEDISHGAIDVTFAYSCYKKGVVFDSLDMVFFSKTAQNLLQDENVYDLVYNSTSTNNYSNSILKWSIFIPFNKDLEIRLQNIEKNLIKNHYTLNSYLLSGVLTYLLVKENQFIF